MDGFPAVNWVPGTLRPYESRVSFWSRFCDLNLIEIKKAGSFFGFAVDEDAFLTLANIRRMSEILCEPKAVLETVFNPRTEFSRCGAYRLRIERRPAESFRYCDECVRLGYHSNLHELEWLSCCPFHLIKLKESYAKECGKGRMSSYVTAMRDLLAERCASWPLIKSFPSDFERGRCFNPFMNWVKKANGAARKLSANEIWRSDSENVESTIRALGRLNGVEPIPKEVLPILKNFNEKWIVTYLEFPVDTRNCFFEIKDRLDFGIIIDFYKTIFENSKSNRFVAQKIEKAREYINARHGRCRCEWIFQRHGWDSHWIRIDSKERPLWTKPCPYEIALEEISDGWGPVDRKRHGYFKIRAIWMDISRKMFDANLIKYTADAKLSPEGYLYASPDCWRACEWNDNSPLTALVNCVVEFEIEAMLSALTEWLDDVDTGEMPGWREEPVDFLRLSDTGTGLRLTQWRRLSDGR